MEGTVLSYEDLLVSKYIDTIGQKNNKNNYKNERENNDRKERNRPGSASSLSTLASPYKTPSARHNKRHYHHHHQHQQKHNGPTYQTSSPYMTSIRRSNSIVNLNEEEQEDDGYTTPASTPTPYAGNADRPTNGPVSGHHVRFDKTSFHHRESRSFDDERVPGHPYRQRLTPARLRRHHSISGLSGGGHQRRLRPGSGRSVTSSVSSRVSSSTAASGFSTASYSFFAHMRQPRVLRVVAFKNGSVDDPLRLAVTPPSLKLLLEEATHKMRLTSAARKLFLKDGTQVGVNDVEDLLMQGGGGGGGGGGRRWRCLCPEENRLKTPFGR